MHDEVGQHAVEEAAAVAVALLAVAEQAKVLGSLGRNVGPQLDDDATCTPWKSAPSTGRHGRTAASYWALSGSAHFAR